MCPLWPFHFILMYVLLFLSAHYVIIAASNTLITSSTIKSGVILQPAEIVNLRMTERVSINLTITPPRLSNYKQAEIRITPETKGIAECSPSHFKFQSADIDSNLLLHFNVTGTFLGKTKISVQLIKTNDYDETEFVEVLSTLPVTVVRRERLVDKLFTISVAVLVSVLFVNFGCALDWGVVVQNFKKPVTLIIALIPQFIFMPLISYLAGTAIFADSIPMQLGLFFTGISPSGGASNVWVCVLGGNLSLSIAITALGNFCAFFTMPLWTFTLGRTIFSSGSMIVPYSKVAIFAFSLMPPLLLGLLLQKKCPKYSQKMVTILKPLSSCLILFIIVFASITNFYLFQLFTWKILAAGLCVPIFGFLSGWVFSHILHRTSKDKLSIAVETCVQNTGISIFMLKFSLQQPEADLTTVIPVAVALMTPVPLLFWYLCQKLFDNISKTGTQKVELSRPISPDERSATNLINQTSSPALQ